MARIRITVWTTAFGEVSVDHHFDETFVEEYDSAEVVYARLTGVAEAVVAAAGQVIHAHSGPFRHAIKSVKN